MQSEFGFLKDLKNHFNLSRIGDDCAIFPKDEQNDYLITSDLLVENIDFRTTWTTPNLIGHKALAISISDVAAMAGSPRFSLLSIAVPEKSWKDGFQDRFYEGYLKLAAEFGVELVGGDISRTGEGIVVDSTIIGVVPRGRAVLRSGAKPGDGIYVTGNLGDAAGGLKLLEGGVSQAELSQWQEFLIEKHLRPMPSDGSGLLEIASSMIDISDGLSSDLRHLCDAANAGARLFAERIPVSEELRRFCKQREQAIELSLHGGEDFALLFTADPDSLPSENCLPYHHIGEITEDPEVYELVTNGIPARLEPGGYEHF